MKFGPNTLRRGGLVAGALALGGLGWLAAVKYVNKERLDIVDRKRAVAKVVTTVDRNTAVTIVAKEGRWYKVDVAGKQGFVAETELSDKPVGAKGKGVSLGAITGMGSVPELETAAAVKGLGEGTRQYASAAGLRTEGLEELIRRREAITPAEFEKFTAAGGLAGAAAAAPATADAPAVASSK